MRQSTARVQNPANIELKKGYVLIERKPEPVSKSGIIMPDGYSRRKVKEGRLFAGGPGLPDLNRSHIGCEVMLHGHAQPLYTCEWEGRQYDLFHGEDIMAVAEAHGA